MYLITPAYAQAATGGGASMDLLTNLVPFAAILVIMYSVGMAGTTLF